MYMYVYVYAYVYMYVYVYVYVCVYVCVCMYVCGVPPHSHPRREGRVCSYVYMYICMLRPLGGGACCRRRERW